MTETLAQERKTARRHRPRGSAMGVYVTDAELIEFLGLPKDIARQAIAALDEDRYSGFPQKDKFFGDRRYLPSVVLWLDKRNGLKLDASPERRERHARRP